MTKLANKDGVHNVHQLRQFLATTKKPRSAAEFNAYPEKKWFNLAVYDQKAKNEDGETVDCQGFVFSCKKMLENVPICLESQPSGIELFIDGTYK